MAMNSFISHCTVKWKCDLCYCGFLRSLASIHFRNKNKRRH